ncbi:MAG: hypothetical protein FWG62_04030 [Proteobacteria bacterium]|nr:hypothetical protein [Pseudomonadota bacterium]
MENHGKCSLLTGASSGAGILYRDKALNIQAGAKGSEISATTPYYLFGGQGSDTLVGGEGKDINEFVIHRTLTTSFFVISMSGAKRNLSSIFIGYCSIHEDFSPRSK